MPIVHQMLHLTYPLHIFFYFIDGPLVGDTSMYAIILLQMFKEEKAIYFQYMHSNLLPHRH